MSQPSLTREDLLIGLIEECSEVIQAATKCLRFGFDRYQSGYGQNNLVLAAEIGDMLSIVDVLPLNHMTLNDHRRSHVAKMLKFKGELRNARPADEDGQREPGGSAV